MTDVKVVSVVRDSEMYDKCVKNNPHFHDCELVVQDNRVENKGIEKYELDMLLNGLSVKTFRKHKEAKISVNY